MRETKRNPLLPIGRTARIACQIQDLRAECCRAALQLSRRIQPDELELEECARLDDALADAQKLLKATVKSIILSRLRRRSRAK